MKLISLTIQNFRCFQDEVTTVINNLTTFVGQNDIGKSSILEALEIFFNNEAVKIEPGDANVFNPESPVVLTCEFTNLPNSLTLDAGAITSLADEYLLTDSGSLRIRKANCSGSSNYCISSHCCGC
jgi:putative ATP-dependent endonuclease of OLD family